MRFACWGNSIWEWNTACGEIGCKCWRREMNLQPEGDGAHAGAIAEEMGTVVFSLWGSSGSR